MKKGSKKARLDIRQLLDRNKSSIFADVKEDVYVLNRWLADATNEDLWRLVNIFRNTKLWDKFLSALLGLPQEVWINHKLVVSKSSFVANEIELIINKYISMGDDFKARAILFNLDYDKYWTRRVKKAPFRTARTELEKARAGLDLGGIPTKPSMECLVELTTYVNSLEENGEE